MLCMGKWLCLFLVSLSAYAVGPAVECESEPHFSNDAQGAKCLERMRLIMQAQDLRGQLQRTQGTSREYLVRSRLAEVESKIESTPCLLTKSESQRNCVSVSRSRQQKGITPASAPAPVLFEDTAPAW